MNSNPSWSNWDTRLGWRKRGYRIRIGAEPVGTNGDGHLVYHDADAEPISNRVQSKPYEESSVTSPSEIVRNWPVYVVSSQIGEKDEICIRNIRAPNEAELFELLKRILERQDLTKLAFLEIHRRNKDGTVSVIFGDNTKPWPKAAVRHESVIYSSKPPAEKASTTPAASTPASNLMALRDNAPVLPPPQPTTVTPTKHPVADELGRPVQSHKREVA